MDFVDSNLLTELIKLAEKSRKQVDNLLRLRVLREFSEAYHVRV